MTAETEALIKGWNFTPMVDSECIHGPADLYAALAVDCVMAGLNARLPKMRDDELELVCQVAYDGASTALRLSGCSTSWADLLPAALGDQAAVSKFFAQVRGLDAL